MRTWPTSGHERIGLILGPPDHMPSLRKLAAFERVARVAMPSELVERTRFSLEGGHAAALRLIERGVTAIICASDPLALGAIRAARRSTLSVPGDLSVVGYDDSALMSCTDPRPDHHTPAARGDRPRRRGDAHGSDRGLAGLRGRALLRAGAGRARLIFHVEFFAKLFDQFFKHLSFLLCGL